MFGGGFKASKCKTLLRLAMARIKLLRNKRDIQVKQMRKDIAQLLQTGQEPSARIRVEHIIREQNTMAAYDILERFCELIIVRLPIIEAQKVCPMDMKESISSVIFASPRCADLPELLQIRTLFSTKYGKEFVAAAAELRPECGVNRRIIEKLSVRAPAGETKLKLMKEIAAENKVEWDPTDSEAELLNRPEDLLDGPKRFYGASSSPLPEVPATVKDNTLYPQRTPNAQPPPPPPSAPSTASVTKPTIQMLPLDQSDSDEVSSPGPRNSSKPQFIPFVVPQPSTRGPVDSVSNAGSSRSSATNKAAKSKYESQKSSSKEDPYSQAKREGRMDYTQPASYDSVSDAAKAAAEAANRAVAAARAAAQLAKSYSRSPSPSRSRKGREKIESDSDEEDSDEEQPRRTNDRRRASTKGTEASVRQERRESLPKRSDSEKRTESASLSRKNVEDEKEFSFRISSQDDRKGSSVKREDLVDRNKPALWRGNSDDRQEGSYRRSNSEDSKESSRRSNSGDRQDSLFRKNSSGDESLFRRNSSGDRDGLFSKTVDEQQESFSGKKVSESRPQFDVEPPPKVDPETESFWKPAEDIPDWRSRRGEYTGLFSSQADDEDMLYQKSSSFSNRNDRGSRYGEGDQYTNTSNIFSRTDSAENNLFKSSDSAEVDLRSSDETPFYDSKPGFPTPKFDDEEFPTSHRNLRLSTRSEEDLFKSISSPSKNISNPAAKQSFNDSWRNESLSHRASEEEEEFVRKYSVTGREDMKPLEKAKSDSLSEVDSRRSENLGRAGSDPLFTRSTSGEEGRPPKHETAIPAKSRRTRVTSTLMTRDRPDEGTVGSPVRKPRTYGRENQESPPHSHSPTTSDDSAFNSNSPSGRAPLTFKATPSSRSSSYQSPETQWESPPPTSLTGSTSASSNTSPPVHPKLPDYDELTMRFEALKSVKR